MSILPGRAGRLALGLAVTAAALGGGAAAAAPTADDGASASRTQAVALAGARPNFKAPFTCGTTWRGSAWWYDTDGTPHSPLRSVDWNQGSYDDDLGKPVRASAAGTVQFSGPTSSGYGNRVVIKHGDSGWKTKYAHLMDGSITVADGQHVNQGQIIGKVGKSGGQRYSHLHYEQIADGNVVDSVVQGYVFSRDAVHMVTSTNAC